MSYSKQREQATQAAQRLLAQAGVREAPVPVEAIARNAGVTVQFIPMDDEMSGMAFIKGAARVAVVNAVHHPNRQRFTLAHELAHHVLHQAYLTEKVHVDTAVLRRNQRSSLGADVKEVQANAFAAELLMPRSLLRKYGRIDINDEIAVQTVANQFKVSVTAMAIRLESLQTVA